MGKRKLREIEECLAEHGLLLMDGDPMLLEEAKYKKEAKKEEALALKALAQEAITPEQIRERASAALFELADEMMARTSSILRFAQGVRKGRRMAGILNTYIGKGFIAATTVEVIAGPVIALQQAEKEGRQVETVAEPLRLVANG